MSEHKTSISNWTAEQKKLYRDRRNKNLRGQVSAVTVHRSVKDDKGDDQRIPLGTKVGSLLSRGKSSDTRAYKREQSRKEAKQEQKTSSNGE